jgi:hypothetical protein
MPPSEKNYDEIGGYCTGRIRLLARGNVLVDEEV